MKRHLIFIFFLFLLNILYSSHSFAQNNNTKFSDSLRINYRNSLVYLTASDTIVSLPDKFLMKNTVSVFIDSVMISPVDYIVDYRYGKIIFQRYFLKKYFSDSLKKNVSVITFYRNYPYNFPDTYSRFEILTKLDTLSKDTISIAEIKTDLLNDIFSGSDLQKSGTIFRGFSVGNNRDFSLNSGFRLQLTGKLSKDIDIVAALTDESTPIQPEGNTQKLQELDKVFIELRSKNITTTLGDIDVSYAGSDFMNFNRKVQGAKGYANFNFSDFFIAGAISRGRFNSNKFNGSDGIQGPYRLVGANNELNIIIIAGSEKVYLDGILLTRGESNDYTIDYGIGELTFTSRRLITSAARIVVDFEYSDKKYSRSLLTSQIKSLVFNDKFKLTLTYIREKDDKDKPIDFALSDSDKQIISLAGSDKLKASKSGVIFVGKDSATNTPLGLYVKVDTVINSSPFIIYKYSPGDTSALYQITFSFVGSGKGDYISNSSTSYNFVGIGQGYYLPIVFLPLPVMYQAGDLKAELNLSKNINFNFETSVSDFDRNLFSGLDDTKNKGLAFNSSLKLSTENLRIGKINLGLVELNFKQRYVNQFFNSIDRLNIVEYYRVWDIQDSSAQTEMNIQSDLTLKPNKFLNIFSTLGYIKRGEGFNAKRGYLNLSFHGDSLKAPAVDYNVEIISSKDVDNDYSGYWVRQNGLFHYNLFPFKDGINLFKLIFELNGEDKKISNLNSDSSVPGSFKFYEFIPGVNFSGFNVIDLSYRFLYRLDDIYNAGEVVRLSKSLTHNFSINIRNIRNFNALFDFTLYDKKYSETFLESGYSDNRSLLINSQFNLSLLNHGIETGLFYKISSERSAKSEVIFYKVPVGQGNYIFLGDLNNNGIQEENEFQLVNYDGDYIKLIVPTDQTYPITFLQTSASILTNPSFIFPKIGNRFIKTLFNNLIFDTYIAISEKSKDPEAKNIYLLKFSHFQNELYTISGYSIFRQDIRLFESNEYFTLRLRFNQKKSFNQYYSGNERQLFIEKSVRLKLTFTPDLSLLTDFVNETNNNSSAQVTLRNWNIQSNSVVTDFTYLPADNIQLGFKLQLSRSIDNYTFQPTQADINSQSARFILALENVGRLRIEAERDETILNNELLVIPYDLTKGKPMGKSFLWSVSFDYRINTFIHSTINYLGRAEGNSRVIHTGTAELRAFF